MINFLKNESKLSDYTFWIRNYDSMQKDGN